MMNREIQNGNFEYTEDDDFLGMYSQPNKTVPTIEDRGFLQMAAEMAKASDSNKAYAMAEAFKGGIPTRKEVAAAEHVVEQICPPCSQRGRRRGRSSFLGNFGARKKSTGRRKSQGWLGINA